MLGVTSRGTRLMPVVVSSRRRRLLQPRMYKSSTSGSVGPLPVANRSSSASSSTVRVAIFTHGVIPGSSHTPALGISSPGIEQGSPHGALQSWRDAMEHYVGLDVSLKLTAICIVDRTGKIEREGVVASDPETIAAFIKSHAPHVARVGLEAGAT